MAGKHDHRHEPKPKPDGPPGRGPKERELAVALTVAVLAAAKPEGSLDDIESLALRTFNRMLDGITQTPQTTAALPPTATIGSAN